MKFFYSGRSVYAIIFTALFLCMSAHAFAQTNIAVIDVQKILNESTAAKSIKKQLDAKRDVYQTEFSRYEKDLRDVQKELTDNNADFSKEDMTEKKLEFEKKLFETKKLVQKRQRALELAAAKASDKLRTETIMIVSDISDEDGYNIVISSQNVLVADQGLDITVKVLKRLNKKIKNIKLELAEE